MWAEQAACTQLVVHEHPRQHPVCDTSARHYLDVRSVAGSILNLLSSGVPASKGAAAKGDGAGATLFSGPISTGGWS